MLCLSSITSSPEAVAVFEVVSLGLDCAEGGASQAMQLESHDLPFLVHHLYKQCSLLHRPSSRLMSKIDLNLIFPHHSY